LQASPSTPDIASGKNDIKEKKHMIIRKLLYIATKGLAHMRARIGPFEAVLNQDANALSEKCG